MIILFSERSRLEHVEQLEYVKGQFLLNVVKMCFEEKNILRGCVYVGSFCRSNQFHFDVF